MWRASYRLVFAADRKFGNVSRARQMNFLAIVGEVITGRIDWIILFGRAEPAHGIELLEAEAQWIDD